MENWLRPEVSRSLRDSVFDPTEDFVGSEFRNGIERDRAIPRNPHISRCGIGEKYPGIRQVERIPAYFEKTRIFHQAGDSLRSSDYFRPAKVG